jgi:hypothetical protein
MDSHSPKTCFGLSDYYVCTVSFGRSTEYIASGLIIFLRIRIYVFRAPWIFSREGIYIYHSIAKSSAKVFLIKKSLL